MGKTSLLHGSLAVAAAAVLLGACAGAPPDGRGFAGGSSGAGGGGGNGGNGSSGGGSGSGGASSGGLFGTSSGGSGTTSADGGTGPVDVSAPCDTGLAIDDPNAASFAKAIGICTSAATDGYGLVSATYSNGFGSNAPPAPGQSGLVPKFGSAMSPREGVRIGVLSSGYAGNYDSMDGLDTGTSAAFVQSGGGPRDGTSYPTGTAPPGFPKAAQGCPQDGRVNDAIDVKLVLKAPPDATGFQFDFDFYSSEWPNYVCSNFNDAFVAYLTSAGVTDNISFDSNHNPVAVNIDFFDRCTPGAPVACLRSNGPTPDPPLAVASCSAGPSELDGTGYGETDQTQCNGSNVTATLGGATGWLVTQASIQPGEQFTLELMIWDAGDGLLDSSVLVDHFQWLGGTITTGTTRVQ
ncbi:MAG TPA: choice-of-anchor L domain-containing protein [Polyangiaceae bacterium]|jgi:hypothetical protein